MKRHKIIYFITNIKKDAYFIDNYEIRQPKNKIAPELTEATLDGED